LSPPPKSPFLAAIRMLGAGTSNRQAKYGVLARPLDWSIAQSGDADAAWQSALDGSPHEIGGEESEGDGHVDLSYAAPLALGDAFRICIRVGKKFLEPAAAARSQQKTTQWSSTRNSTSSSMGSA
jgi:hypothetical protein